MPIHCGHTMSHARTHSLSLLHPARGATHPPRPLAPAIPPFHRAKCSQFLRLLLCGEIATFPMSTRMFRYPSDESRRLPARSSRPVGRWSTPEDSVTHRHSCPCRLKWARFYYKFNGRPDLMYMRAWSGGLRGALPMRRPRTYSSQMRTSPTMTATYVLLISNPDSHVLTSSSHPIRSPIATSTLGTRLTLPELAQGVSLEGRIQWVAAGRSGGTPNAIDPAR